MSGSTPWPCPICTELIEPGYYDCPHCHTAADWIDLIGAIDFSIRRFELWKLEGAINKEQFRRMVESCRQKRKAMIDAVHSSKPYPDDTGLPRGSSCWRCKTPSTFAALKCNKCGSQLNTPEVRLLRYQAYVCAEIQRFADFGYLSNAQWQAFLNETPERQIELLGRLEKGWTPI